MNSQHNKLLSVSPSPLLDHPAHSSSEPPFGVFSQKEESHMKTFLFLTDLQYFGINPLKFQRFGQAPRYPLALLQNEILQLDPSPISASIFEHQQLYVDDGLHTDEQISDGDLQLSDQNLNNFTLAANLTAEESHSLNQRHKISGSEQKPTTQF